MRIAEIIVVAALLVAVVAWPGPASAQTALDEHGGPVKGVALSADGSRALTASFDYSVILWDLSRRTALVHLYGHEAAVNDVAFLPGERAISASDDGTLAIWDLDQGELVTRINGHRGKVTAVAVAPGGHLAASVGWDRTVRIWDLDRGAQLRELRGRDNLNTVQFSADGERVAAGGSDGSVQIWRVADGTQISALDAHDFAVTRLDLTADGGIGATASVDETVQLWRLPEGEPGMTLYGHDGPVLAVAVSPDGELVASGGVDGTVRVWRRGDGDRLRVYARHHGAVWAVAFTQDGETVVSGGADGLVLTYDLAQEPSAPPSARVAATATGLVDDGTRGAELFRKCSACHTVTPDGGHRAGPTLYGLFGREAGSRAGYPYSKALRESDVVWTEETVGRLFAIGPDEFVPGSKMPLQRMPDAADRKRLVAYLKRITAPERHD